MNWVSGGVDAEKVDNLRCLYMLITGKCQYLNGALQNLARLGYVHYASASES